MKPWRHIALAAALAAVSPLHAQSAPDFSPRVMQLLHQLTLTEKLAMTMGMSDPVAGEQAGYTPGVPRLGIPPLRWVDGPGGIDNRYDTVSLPQPIALAATFDRQLAYAYGSVQGTETRATDMDVFLGPMVNIARLPNWRRNATSQGEDPYLDAEITFPQVKAIQAQGVIASVKHFIAYNQTRGVDSDQHQKAGDDFIVDQRTLHEIELPAFEAGIEAGTGSVMAAYSKINGYQNADNPDTLQHILRGELGFKGFVESDWGANHGTESILNGLDVEFTGNGADVPRKSYFGLALQAAIASGKVSQSALDRAVGDVLTAMDQVGMLDHRRVPPPNGIDIAGDEAVALKTAEESAVLLKNDGALPLDAKALGSLVMVGPIAGQLLANPGFGSSEGLIARKVSPMEAMRRVAGPGTRITYAVGQDLTGLPIPATALTPQSGTGDGLTRIPGDGSPLSVDPTIDFTGANSLPAARAYIWRGTLKVPTPGDYVLMAQGWGGGAELKIDGQVNALIGISRLGRVAKKTSSILPTTDNLDNGRAHTHLEAGKPYLIELTAHGWADQPLQVRLNWVTPEMRQHDIDAAAAAARDAHAAVVFAWQRAGEEANPEKDLLLPEDQNALIEAVTSANPNTVVVLTSSPVQMPWLSKVRAVLEVWFAGQAGGTATAEILTGKVDPSGKLPITFPARMEDTPADAPGHPERYVGVDGKVIYSEGVFVGYRWYDRNKLRPLFPFGYGLSYTKFRYTDVHTKRNGDAVEVSFKLTNTGKVAGTEVAQVYVGPPAKASVPMAPKQLSGFERVELAPGQTKTVTLRLDPRRFAYWSTADRGWRIASGRRPIYIGSSSRDIRLTSKVSIKSY
jgi:beta-glucosidase